QTMMGVAPATAAPYQGTGYQAGYQQQPYGGGYDGGGERRGGGRRWIGWLIAGIVVLAAIAVAVVLLKGSGSGGNVNVPLVNGLSWTKAQSEISAAGLMPVENKTPSTSIKPGIVISTNPDNGNSVAKNSTVTVNVSTGPAKISLPSLQGQQGSAAQAQLKKLGFTNVSLVSDPQSTAPANTVDHQTPGPGSYPSDQQITLYVSGGGMKVPDVTNQTVSEATAILQQDGFTVNVNNTAAPASQMVEPGTVYNQNPSAGQVKQKGTQIQIFVQPQSTSPTSTPTGTSTQPTGTPTNTPTNTPTTGTPTDTPTTGAGGLLPG
ncbi:MAG: PASTA domain-containing protein, partial [Trebonia sp.]